MRVLVTGASGFIGSHCTATLLAQGHTVRALVRSRDKLARVLAAHHCEPPECVEGDVAEADTVSRALTDCDAVIHTAARVSTSARDGAQVTRTNVEGSRQVIGQAAALGLRRIIHVSSVAAIYQPTARRLTGNEALASSTTHYGQSKAEAERHVRALQAEGAPIGIVYPAAVAGPLDPGLSEPHDGLRIFLQRTAVLTSSGLQVVDVRDVALALSHLLTAQPCPPRITLGGHYLPWAELTEKLEQLTARRLWKLPVPGPLLRGVGVLGDLWAGLTGLGGPISSEGMRYATQWVPTDDQVARALGVNFRPAEDTLRDALLSLVRSGQLKARDIGRLAEQL